MVLFKVFFRLAQLVIQAAQRRAAITGDVACRGVTLLLIALPLGHGQTNKRLSTCNENTPLTEGVFIVELDCLLGHHSTPPLNGDLLF
ncbi:hypothetical protein D3C86_1773940 [compost metagenome]